MTATAASDRASGTVAASSAVVLASTRPGVDVAHDLAVDPAAGLSSADADRGLLRGGANVVASHRVRPWAVLGHQLRSPLLGLLVAAATTSFVVGERQSALIIVAVVALSVGLGFVNELRAERAAATLHTQVHHTTSVLRDGAPTTVDVTELVVGDVVTLRLGTIVPADLRLLAVAGLECAESVLTGESLPVAKSTAAVPPATPLGDLVGCALMGTVVSAGSGTGVVVATGPRTELGTIAAGLATRPPDTGFQLGLTQFSLLLVRVAGVLTSAVLVVNIALGKPLLDAVLFSLAIAVGITPQLLPAVVSTSLAAGSRRMTAHHVLVKRLVCIEDLGDLDLLLTDKTGTLTLGRIDYLRALPVRGHDAAEVVDRGLAATESGTGGGGNPLDEALWRGAGAVPPTGERVAVLPFDHERRMVSVLRREPGGGLLLVTKGAPESVLGRCTGVDEATRTALAAEFAAGNRVVAVATRPVTSPADPTPADEHGLHLVGLLVFADPPKPGARQALDRLADLGVAVKVVTGDNATVAAKVCRDLGLLTGDAGVLSGADVDGLDDDSLAAAIATTVVFARVSPEHKARIVRVARRGSGVGFLGDGVNDALALHAADVGISVDSATDVAKDAADVILLEKDLGVLADGVTEGRLIFANTMKYVLMGTSSNVGNMVSAAAASVFLSFLPMLPSQILLNNLLYDTSQLAIPTDGADPEQLRRPAQWDLAFIRRFMLFFGPLSSVFDFATFAIMLGVFHSGPEQFRSGWFVESLATQTLVIFAIRTRRVPFFRSHPSVPLTLSALAVVTVGAAIPATPLARTLGFQPLPAAYFATLAGLVVGYLLLVEVGKTWFYRAAATAAPTTVARTRHRRFTPHHHVRRRAAYFGGTHTRSHLRSRTATNPGPMR